MTAGMGLRRATLFVRDLDRMRAFYEGVFGLTLYRELEVDLSRVKALPIGAANPESGSARFIILRGADPLVGMVGLMQVTAPALPEANHDVRRLGYGSVALVMAVKDADQAAADAARLGGEVIQPVTTARNIGDVAGEFVPVKMFMAYDPEGHFLEVFAPL